MSIISCELYVQLTQMEKIKGFAFLSIFIYVYPIVMLLSIVGIFMLFINQKMKIYFMNYYKVYWSIMILFILLIGFIVFT